jgi:membrane protein DedA with SNARE-associated domain
MHLPDSRELTDLLATWGYPGIVACVFAGNLGIPVPEETVLIAAGFLAGRDLMNVMTVYVVVVASAVTGDCCGFLIGRTGGHALLERLASRFDFLRRRLDQVRVFFDQHGAKAVFMARFIAGARFMAGPMAGAAGMPFLRFLAWNLAGAIVWCALMVSIGYLVGDEIWRAVDVIHSGVRWIAVTILLIVIAAYVVRWRTHAAPRPDARA